MIAPPGIPNITSTPSASRERRIASPPVIFTARLPGRTPCRVARCGAAQHGVDELARRRGDARAGHLRGPPRRAQRSGEALLERLPGRGPAETLGEEEGRREQHGARVDDPVPGEVARRALRRAEEAGAGRREVTRRDEPAAAAELGASATASPSTPSAASTPVEPAARRRSASVSVTCSTSTPGCLSAWRSTPRPGVRDADRGEPAEAVALPRRTRGRGSSPRRVVQRREHRRLAGVVEDARDARREVEPPREGRRAPAPRRLPRPRRRSRSPGVSRPEACGPTGSGPRCRTAGAAPRPRSRARAPGDRAPGSRRR